MVNVDCIGKWGRKVKTVYEAFVLNDSSIWGKKKQGKILQFHDYNRIMALLSLGLTFYLSSLILIIYSFSTFYI